MFRNDGVKLGWRLILFTVAGIGLTRSSITYAQETDPRGLFSAVSTSLLQTFNDHITLTVNSPDGQSKIIARAEGETLVLRVEGRIGSSTLKFGGGPNAEVEWSPDSEAFWITDDWDGLSGLYRLTVVGRANGRLKVHHLSSIVGKKFGHPVRCFEREPANVAGIGWLGSSHELLAVAEITPHSNCDGMGTFKAYKVDPWRMVVLKTYTQREAKEQFAAMLGPRPLNATDCDQDPKACYIPQLHPELR